MSGTTKVSRRLATLVMTIMIAGSCGGPSSVEPAGGGEPAARDAQDGARPPGAAQREESGTSGTPQDGADGATPALAPARGDWCSGHGVPESMCTICNPSLIPAFQAKGDWCAEHGLPESVCPQCNPSAAAKRPGSASGSVDSAVQEAGADWCSGHGVPESMCTICNPSLISSFQAKGDWCAEHGLPESVCPLCAKGPAATGALADEAPIDKLRVRFKSAETYRLAGIRTAPALARAGEARLRAMARIIYDARRHADINARADGVVQEIRVDVGSRVSRGATLAVIESAEVGEAQSRLAGARTRVEVAEADHERHRKLFEDGIVPRKDLLEAQQELEAARADADGARSTLAMVGAGGGTAGRYPLLAPIDGVVTRRDVSLGRFVETEETLFEIVDTSTMWAEIDLPENALGSVAEGAEVTLTVDGLSDRVLRGRIDYIAPEVDPQTRTARARVLLRNTDAALRGNMFARAEIELAASRGAVMIPREALQTAKGTAIVFVKLGDALFETRRVATGIEDGSLVEITKGVRAGEEVVTEGSFLLKTETLKGSIGAGCCDVE